MKCALHELRPGEFADGERYRSALIESETCWRCQALAAFALVKWKLGTVWRWRVHGERTAAPWPPPGQIDAEFEEEHLPARVEVTADGVTRLPDAMVAELGHRIWFLRGKEYWEAWPEDELERVLGDAPIQKSDVSPASPRGKT